MDIALLLERTCPVQRVNIFDGLIHIYIYTHIYIYIHLYIIRYILTPSLCNSPRKISWTIQSYQNFCLNKLFNVVLFRLYIYGWYWCFRNCVIMSRGEYKCCKWYKIFKKRLFISLFVLSGETNFWNWPLWQRRKRSLNHSFVPSDKCINDINIYGYTSSQRMSLIHKGPIFSHAFSWKKSFAFWFRYHWILSIRAKLVWVKENISKSPVNFCQLMA